jgi:MFS family permease
MLVVGAKATSFIGDEAAVIALTLALAWHGPWAVAGLMLSGFAPMIVMAPLAGMLVDRHDSRHLLVVTCALQTATCAVLAYTTSLPIIFGLIFLLGAGQAVTSATWSALVPGIVGLPNVPKAIGLSQAITNAAMILAPALGGVLVGLGGTRAALARRRHVLRPVRGGSVHRSPPADRKDRRTRRRRRAGLRVIRADHTLALLTGMLFLFVLLGAMVNVVAVFLIRFTLYAGPIWFAPSPRFSGSHGRGSLLSSRISGQPRLLRGTVVSMVMLSASMLAYGAAPSILWLAVPAVLAGLGNALLNATANTVIALRVPEAVRGRVGSALGGLMAASMVGAMLLGGIAASTLTPRQVFLLAGLLGLIVPVVVGRRLLRTASITGVPVAGQLELVG